MASPLGCAPVTRHSKGWILQALRDLREAHTLYWFLLGTHCNSNGFCMGFCYGLLCCVRFIMVSFLVTRVPTWKDLKLNCGARASRHIWGSRTWGTRAASLQPPLASSCKTFSCDPDLNSLLLQPVPVTRYFTTLTFCDFFVAVLETGPSCGPASTLPASLRLWAFEMRGRKDVWNSPSGGSAPEISGQGLT